MKIYVHYDNEGTIRSIVAIDAPDGAGMMLTPKPGRFVAPIDGVKLKSRTAKLEELRAIAEGHRISTPLPHATLVKR